MMDRARYVPAYADMAPLCQFLPGDHFAGSEVRFAWELV